VAGFGADEGGTQAGGEGDRRGVPVEDAEPRCLGPEGDGEAEGELDRLGREAAAAERREEGVGDPGTLGTEAEVDAAGHLVRGAVDGGVS
jgi:hypothetical protein